MGKDSGLSLDFSATMSPTCEIPLLGGTEHEATERIIVTLEFKRGSELCEIAKQVNGSLSAVCCVAWSLLLKCYTGQDIVCFVERELQSEGTEDCSSVFTWEFQEQDTISACIQRTTAALLHSSQDFTVVSLEALKLNSSVRSWNTTLTMRGGGLEPVGKSDLSRSTGHLDPTQVCSICVYPMLRVF